MPPYYPKVNCTPCADEFIASWTNTDYVYVNAIARVKNRSLSIKQIYALSDLFNTQKEVVGIFYTDYPIEETSWVKRLPTMPFADFSEVVQNCKAVISPDTAVVHLGSIYNLPVFGIYSGNNRDYWPQYAMQDVWAPLSEGSVIYVEDDPETTWQSDFEYRHPRKPIASYAPEAIAGAVRNFLIQIGLFKK